QVEFKLACEAGVVVRVRPALVVLLLHGPDHRRGIDAHCLGEVEEFPRRHVLDVADVGDMLGGVRMLAEAAAQEAAGKDVNVGQPPTLLPVPHDLPSAREATFPAVKHSAGVWQCEYGLEI